MTTHISLWKRIAAGALLLACGIIGAAAQNSLPAPGTGGIGGPGPGGMGPGPGGMGPGWGAPAWSNPAWGNPGWGGSIWNNPTPGFSINIGVNNPNAGVMTIAASGYDSYGVWRTIPVRVQYNYTGVGYNVTVLSAWDPWMGMWNRNIDIPAYSTIYVHNGNAYHYYAPLSTGTYYFNL